MIPRSISEMVFRLLLIFFVATIMFETDAVQAQVSYGAFGELSANEHNADFQHLPGLPDCCPRYETGSGLGSSVGGFVQWPLADRFDLRVRAGYHNISGKLSEIEQTVVLHNNVPTIGAFEHTIDASLGLLALEPMINWNALSRFHLMGGFRVGTPLKKSYVGQESITQPDGAGTFLDTNGNDSHSRIRNQSSGDIPGASSALASALAAVAYELPMNRHQTLALEPTVLFSYAFTPIATDLKWYAHSLRAGVSVVYTPRDIKTVHEERHIIDTIKIQKRGPVASIVKIGKEERTETTEFRDWTDFVTTTFRRTDTSIVSKPAALTASVTAVGVEADGTEVPAARIVHVEEYASTLITPMLNYIFFDEGSSTIPNRYIREDSKSLDTFRIEHLPRNTLAVYYHILDVVARRLKEHPSATITLTGCNQDVQGEQGNLQLSRARAEAVKSYMTDVWGISGNRIKIAARNLPEKHASRDNTTGMEENRRVEITSSDASMFLPVALNDTIRKTNPPMLRFRPTVTAEAGLKSWQLAANQQSNALTSYHGESTIPGAIDWKFDESSVPRSNDNIDFNLAVHDSDNNTENASGNIAIDQVTLRKKREERRGDTVIDRFSLILFDVGSSSLTPQHGALINLIKSHVGPGSNVSVTGYTDRLGNPQANERLAKRRSEAVVEALGTSNATVNSVPEASLYDDTLPEGRLYTRNVQVTVMTPTK